MPDRDTLGFSREVTGTVALDEGSTGTIERSGRVRVQHVQDCETRRVLEMILVALEEIKETLILMR